VKAESDDVFDQIGQPDREKAEAPEDALADAFAQTLRRWAQHSGARVSDLDWIAAAAHALSLACSSGRICLDLDTITSARGAHNVQTLRDALLNCGLTAQPQAPHIRPLFLDHANRLYLYRFYIEERRFAQALVRRLLSPPLQNGPEQSPAALDGASPEEQLDTLQSKAIGSALANSLTILCGGPGTGKTTTVVKILAAVLQRNPTTRVALAAPTGKAAARLLEAIHRQKTNLNESLRGRFPQEAFTLHRLLQTRPDSLQSPFHEGNPLPIDLLVVDEASMLDLPIAVRVIRALPPQAKLILVGDPQQLPAIDAGGVFAKLASVTPAQLPLLSQSVVRLHTPRRFTEQSAIFGLAQAIQGGNPDELFRLLSLPQVEGVKWLSEDTHQLDEATLACALEGFADYFAAVRETLTARAAQGYATIQLIDRLFESFESFRVLCAIRHSERGVAHLNRQLFSALRAAIGADGNWGREETLAQTSRSGNATGCPGQPVLLIQNDHELKIYNGDVGIYFPDDSGQMKVWFRNEGSFFGIARQRLPQHDDAFATTVHKAQGTEFKAVMLILPSAARHTATREMLYTAITRARSRVVISSSRAALEVACATTTEQPSGILDRMDELLRSQ
jgi:exodeoxyribonuclease V alpha subunit